MINTSQTERHKDDIADGIGARMQTSEKTGGIIFFGLKLSKREMEYSRGFPPRKRRRV